MTVAQPLQQEVIDCLEFTGTTRGYEEVEVRARVSGFLKGMEFTPGTQVEEGDLLFVIDPCEYEAELNAATRQAIGTAVGGAATLMSLLFTPVFYMVMQHSKWVWWFY